MTIDENKIDETTKEDIDVVFIEDIKEEQEEIKKIVKNRGHIDDVIEEKSYSWYFQ